MTKTVRFIIKEKERDLEPQMSWPPEEDDYITYLLDVFLTVRISGKSLDSESSSTEKNR